MLQRRWRRFRRDGTRSGGRKQGRNRADRCGEDRALLPPRDLTPLSRHINLQPAAAPLSPPRHNSRRLMGRRCRRGGDAGGAARSPPHRDDPGGLLSPSPQSCPRLLNKHRRRSGAAHGNGVRHCGAAVTVAAPSERGGGGQTAAGRRHTIAGVSATDALPF